MGSFSLEETSRFLLVLLPLKWVCIPYLPHIFLMLLQRPWVYGITMWPFALTSLLVGWVPVVPCPLGRSLTSLADLVSLCSTLSKAHLGYLQLVRAFLRCSISFWRSLGLLQTVLALWERVLMKLYFAERWWWLSLCKYWSMCVGFLYTVMDSLPSFSGFTMVPKKGMAPSSLLFSTVNCMARSTTLMYCRKFCLISSFWMMKCHPYTVAIASGWEAVLGAFCKIFRLCFWVFCGDVVVSDGTAGLISMVRNSFFQGPVGFTYVFSCAVGGWAFPVVDYISFLCICSWIFWMDGFGCRITIIDRESNTLHHQAKEALHIHIKDPSLSRNIGKVRVPSVFNILLKPPRQLKLPHSSILPPKGARINHVFSYECCYVLYYQKSLSQKWFIKSSQ